MKKSIVGFVVLVIMLCSSLVFAGEKYKIAYSHYTGWEPWAYIQSSGVLKKWADKYPDVDSIDVVLINDYIESINFYTAGKYIGCTMTNMDALTIPAVSGIRSEALIVGDFSNGNDGIVIWGAGSVKDLKGKNVYIVELSVSHYMLARALEMNGMTERDITVVNTSDADIAAVFLADPDAAVVTWNPQLMQVRSAKGANMIFDSSMIPGEIIDMLVVRENAPENVKRALVGAWYEAMRTMSGRGKTAKAAIADMANAAGGTEQEFRSQLRTTAIFYAPSLAAEFIQSKELKGTMDQVVTFSFDHGLYGDGAPDKNFVGIRYADDSVQGDSENVQLIFPVKYTQMAADGAL